MGNIIITQLRSEHCPKTKYYEKRIGKAIDARCDDCGEGEDKDYIWKCMRWEKERRIWWHIQQVKNEWSGSTEGEGSFSEVSQENQERLVYMRRAVARAHTHTHTHTLMFRMESWTCHWRRKFVIQISNHQLIEWYSPIDSVVADNQGKQQDTQRVAERVARQRVPIDHNSHSRRHSKATHRNHKAYVVYSRSHYRRKANVILHTFG